MFNGGRRTGSGQAGPLDSSVNPFAGTIETGVELPTKMFHARLQALGIPGFFDDYGPGTHAWPYWARDLRESIGPIMSGLHHPAPTPNRVAYTSADPSYSAFGWRVTMHREVTEFSAPARAGARGFTLRGSGSATVTTPAHYRPGWWYETTVRWRDVNRSWFERARRDRRLDIEVPLGPSNTVQEYATDGPAASTTVYSTQIRIARLR